MGKVLVIYHIQGGTTEGMANAILEGARQVGGTDVHAMMASEATADDLLGCDAIAVGSPPYFTYTAGGPEDVLEQALYRTRSQVAERPCAVFGSVGGPASAVLEYVERICFFVMKFKKAADSVTASGELTEQVLNECRLLGKKLAEAARK
jgi:flavorubredoxin